MFAIRSQKGEQLASRARLAESFLDRRTGLIGTPSLGPGEALMIAPAKQIHTFGMAYPIDVVFCDRRMVVLHVVRAMRPTRITKLVLRARCAIESPAGAAARIEVGDRLYVEDPPSAR